MVFIVKAQTSPAMLQSVMQFYLELIVNDVPTQHVAQVDYRDGHYYISTSDLQFIHFPVDLEYRANSDNQIAIDTIKGVHVTYDQTLQRLYLYVPSSWLPEQHIISPYARTRYPPQSSLGALINYDIYATKPSENSGSINTWNELRLFDPQGTFSHTGVYHKPF